MSVRFCVRMIRFVMLATLLVFAAAAAAQDPRVDMAVSPTVQSAQDLLDGADRKLTTIQTQVEENAENDTKLIDLKLALEDLSRQMINVGVSLRPRLTEVKSQIDLLGAPPGPDEAEEPAETKAQRARLTQERSVINTLTGRAETISIRANEIGDQITETRRNLFTGTLLKRTEINGSFFTEAAAAIVVEGRNVQRVISSWFNFVWSFKFNQLMAATFLASLVTLVVVFFSFRFFGRFIERDAHVAEPGYLQRLTVAFWSVVIPTLALIVIFGSTLLLYSNFAVLRVDITKMLAGLFASLLLVNFVSRVAKAILAPYKPQWRLIGFSNKGARRVYYLIVLMAVVNAIDYVLGAVSETLGSPVVLTVAKSFFATIVVGLILTATARVRPMMSQSGNPADPSRSWPQILKILLVVSGVGMVALSLIGYVGLSKFVAEQILLTGAILAMMYIGFLSGQATMEQGAFEGTTIGRGVHARFQPSAGSMDRIGLAFGLLIYCLVLAFGLPLILLQWGFQVQDIELWVYRAFTDIRFGGISISLTGILVGILLFLAGLFGTRKFERWLDSHVLARSRMDPGVRNSISTGVGYLGVAVAGLIGVLAAGINLSSLAIVAGALSLGIGFGLQNIVSNFVSGLILLAERPFKVGDWVETGTTQGFVKRISVRATEIETFQRQSLIVPNSELINGVVGNWNHRNSVGRADIEVGVSYSADPEKVLRILEEIALAHETVLRNPEPVVHFVNFGASSLDFVLKVFLADVLNGMGVKNDLRVAIYKRFKEEGIEIPFPQTDVNFSVKDAPPELLRKFAGTDVVEMEDAPADPPKPGKRKPVRRAAPDSDPSEM
jgi:potassium-dependent mechanosensitive channel